LLTVGETIADTFQAMYFFEATCMIQIRAQAGGGELIPISQPILDGAKAQMKIVTKGLGGNLAWPGLLRKLDRIDASFRQ
jgi:ribulose-5-phosphate 4-epimerase/fuculose-1-phosphate aldolase